MKPQYSYSRVDCFDQCPLKYKMRYLDKIIVEQDVAEDNALILGTAMHTGIELGLNEGLNYYMGQFPCPTQAREWEIIKLKHYIPPIHERFEGSCFESHVARDNFHGYIDCITYDGKHLWDFKYANAKNVDKYADSPQVHLYAWATGREFETIGYYLIPKISIRQKKDETPEMFRNRLVSTLSEAEPIEIVVDYDPAYVDRFKEDVERMETCTDFIPVVTKLCDWCEYKPMCEAHQKD